jgi:hypothetical protein
MADDKTMERLIKVLLSPSVSKINFSALGAAIAPQKMSRVLAALVLGTVRIETSGAGMLAGSAASYTHSKNLYSFPHGNYGVSHVEQMHMLHESVHAAADLEGNWLSFYFDWEVVSYISGAIFHRLLSGGGPPTNWKDIFQVADALGQTVLTSPGARIDMADAWKLRQLIVNDPTYAGMTPGKLSGNDGA